MNPKAYPKSAIVALLRRSGALRAADIRRQLGEWFDIDLRPTQLREYLTAMLRTGDIRCVAGKRYALAGER